MSESAAHHELIGINSFLACLVVLLCLTLGGLLQRYKVHQLSASGASILFGVILGLILSAIVPHSQEASIIAFNPELFFFILLPPIIFDSGYNLEKSNFFENIGTITLYAIVGTLVTCISFGYLLYTTAKLGFIPLDSNSPLECLLLGAVVSATDPVATIAMLTSSREPTDKRFHSLVFGESVLNDAIALVLVKILSSFLVASRGDDASSTGGAPTTDAPAQANESQFTAVTLLSVFGQFILTTVGSIGIGVIVALIASFVMRKLRNTQHSSTEWMIVFLFSYMSYALAESIGLSGIASIFFSSLVLAHYCHHSLSDDAKTATLTAFTSLSHLSETAVFAYVGVTAGLSFTNDLPIVAWNAPLCISVLVACFVSRAVHIFPLTLLFNELTPRRSDVPLRMQAALWWAGGLRGPVAFAMALNFASEPARPYVVAACIVLVLTTVLLCGGSTLYVLKATGMTGEKMIIMREREELVHLEREARQLAQIEEDDALHASQQQQQQSNNRLDPTSASASHVAQQQQVRQQQQDDIAAARLQLQLSPRASRVQSPAPQQHNRSSIVATSPSGAHGAPLSNAHAHATATAAATTSPRLSGINHASSLLNETTTSQLSDLDFEDARSRLRKQQNVERLMSGRVRIPWYLSLWLRIARCGAALRQRWCEFDRVRMRPLFGGAPDEEADAADDTDSLVGVASASASASAQGLESEAQSPHLQSVAVVSNANANAIANDTDVEMIEADQLQRASPLRMQSANEIRDRHFNSSESAVGQSQPLSKHDSHDFKFADADAAQKPRNSGLSPRRAIKTHLSPHEGDPSASQQRHVVDASGFGTSPRQ